MAYALGPLRPDDRHGRIFQKRRPRRLFMIALTSLAMLGAAGGFLGIYREMTDWAAPADVPVLHADPQPTRHRPDNPGGMDIPGQGTMVLDGGHGEPKSEQLLPPPEAPLPRPALANDLPPPPALPAPAVANSDRAATAGTGDCRGTSAHRRSRAPADRRRRAAARGHAARAGAAAGTSPCSCCSAAEGRAAACRGQRLSPAARRRALAGSGEAGMGPFEAAIWRRAGWSGVCRATRRSRRARHLLPRSGRPDRRRRQGRAGVPRIEAARRGLPPCPAVSRRRLSSVAPVPSWMTVSENFLAR